MRARLRDITVPLVGASNEGVNRQADSQRTINLFPVKMEREGEKVRWHLVGTPGLALHTTLPRSPIRGEHVVDGRYFCIAGARIYEIYGNGSYREWGRINSTSGKVSMADLLGVLVIGDGTGFYGLTLATGVVDRISDAPRGRFCVFFNSRILYHERDTGRVWYSALNDATSVPDLNYFTAERLPDDITAIVTTEDQIWLIGEGSTETWFDSGDTDNPFQPINGGVVYSGCQMPDTALRLDNSVWWVEQDEHGRGIVRRSQGFTPARVSTAPVERFTATATNMSAFGYQEQGRTFFVLNADQGTWAYDLKDNEWHERAWLNRLTGEQERGRPETHAYAYGLHLVSDYENGRVYSMSLDHRDDAGQEIRRTRVTGHVDFDARSVIIDELYIDIAAGVGLDGVGQGTDPKVMLRYSTDGITFSNELMGDLGGIGKYGQLVRFFGLGLGRDWVFEVSVSDPVAVTILGASARVRIGFR